MISIQWAIGPSPRTNLLICRQLFRSFPDMTQSLSPLQTHFLRPFTAPMQQSNRPRSPDAIAIEWRILMLLTPTFWELPALYNPWRILLRIGLCTAHSPWAWRVGWHFGTRAILRLGLPQLRPNFSASSRKAFFFFLHFCIFKALLRLSLPKVNIGALIIALDAGLLDISFFAKPLSFQIFKCAVYL